MQDIRVVGEKWLEMVGKRPFMSCKFWESAYILYQFSSLQIHNWGHTNYYLRIYIIEYLRDEESPITPISLQIKLGYGGHRLMLCRYNIYAFINDLYWCRGNTVCNSKCYTLFGHKFSKDAVRFS